MAEMIRYGGMAATREEVYADALRVCGTRTDNPRQAARAADMFAFGPRTVVLTPQEAAALPRFDPRTGEPVGFQRKRRLRKDHLRIPRKENGQP
jgi:hypothetical protein